MDWWSEWLILLLLASGFLTICNGGWTATLLLWILYIGNGMKQVESVKKITGRESEENENELNTHIMIGVIVLAISGIIRLVSFFD